MAWDESRETYIGRTSYSAVSLEQRSFKHLCHVLAGAMHHALQVHDAQAIAVRGTSGTSVAFGMRQVYDLPFIICRKSGENSHDGVVTGAGCPTHISRYIILDDLVSSGSTVAAIMEDLDPAECKGVYTYTAIMDRILDRATPPVVAEARVEHSRWQHPKPGQAQLRLYSIDEPAEARVDRFYEIS